jgi:hypothetical protein
VSESAGGDGAVGGFGALGESEIGEHDHEAQGDYPPGRRGRLLGQTMKELIENLYDAVEGCLSVDIGQYNIEKTDTVMDLAI